MLLEGKYLFLKSCSGTSLSILDVARNALVQRHELGCPIVSLVSYNNALLIALDKKVILFNLNKSSIDRSWKVHQGISSLSLLGDTLYVLSRGYGTLRHEEGLKKKAKGEMTTVLTINLADDQARKATELFGFAGHGAACFSPSFARLLYYCSASNELVVRALLDGSSVSIALPSIPLLICSHKEDGSFFYADKSGCIHHCYQLLPTSTLQLLSKKQRSVHRLHWHASQPSVMELTEDGQFLVSGGTEGVLVLWSLSEGHGSESRRFLPHLNSPISALSLAKDCFAVRTNDEAIHMVSPSSMNISSVFYLPRIGTPHSQLVQDPFNANSVYVLPGLSGTMLSCDVPAQKGVELVDVAQQNAPSNPDSASAIVSQVRLTAISPSMKRMATWDDGDSLSIPESSSLQVLRFWRREKGKWLQQKAFQRIHRSLSCLSFSSSYLLSGGDSQAIIWSENQNKWFPIKKLAFRGMSVSSAAFSQDGSVLAITYSSASASLIVLYETEGFSQVAVFEASAATQSWLSFSEDCLIHACPTGVSVYDLGSLSLTWSLRLSLLSICFSPSSFAMLVNDGHKQYILTMGVEKPVPLACYRHSNPLISISFACPKVGSEEDDDGVEREIVQTTMRLVALEESSQLVVINSLQEEEEQEMEQLTWENTPLSLDPVQVPNAKRTMSSMMIKSVPDYELFLRSIPGHELPDCISAFSRFIRIKLTKS